MKEENGQLVAMALQSFYSAPDELTLQAALDVMEIYCTKETTQEAEALLKAHLELIQNGSISPHQD